MNFSRKYLKKDFRSQNKRKKNNLKKHGTLKFKVINDQKEINSLLVELFEQKNIRLSSKKSEILKKDLMFYKDLLVIKINHLNAFKPFKVKQ